MIFDVTAEARDPKTDEHIAGPRTERIDTETNVLFENAKTPEDVKAAYEAFWNDLPAVQRERIVVLDVTLIA